MIELLRRIAILGIIFLGLQQVIGTCIYGYQSTKEKQELLVQARYAMERMAMFVQESDVISRPDTDSNQEILRISERLLDTYNNNTHFYAIDGDNMLDGDNNSNNLVNDNPSIDPSDYVTFDLDKTDANNWKLMEQLPNYSTASLSDFLPRKVIAEYVKTFKCNLLRRPVANFFPNLVEIELTLNNGKNEITLKTRVRARLLD